MPGKNTRSETSWFNVFELTSHNPQPVFLHVFNPPSPRFANRQLSPVSLSHGGGSSEVGEEFVTEADHKIPDVSGHLRAGNEDSPDEDNQDGVESVADVPQSGKQKGIRELE